MLLGFAGRCSRSEAHARGGDGNHRNGTSRKTVATEVGPVELNQPRDRQGSFASQLVPKGARRLGGLEDQIISLYAGGMTVREIEHHLARTLGVEPSHESIANVADAVPDEVTAGQNRPLDEFYSVVFLDAIHIKIRDGAHVKTRAVHIAVGVDLEGVKHVLGIWVQATEGAAFWASVCAELANRGVKDVLIVAWADRPVRGDRRDLAVRRGPDMRGAPDPRVDAVRGLQRSPRGGRRAQTGLHDPERRGCSPGAGGLRRFAPGRQVPHRPHGGGAGPLPAL